MALGRVLLARGCSLDEVDRLLRVDLAGETRLLGDPPGIDHAASILLGFAGRAKVGLLCDYDVDGATAAAILTFALRWLGTEPVVAVPERLEESFGPNRRCLDELVAAGCGCVVTLDCGTAAAPLLQEYEREHGLYPIVLDHHPDDAVLDPGVLVNPWLAPEGRQHRNLCAAALSWFLARALLRLAGADAAGTLQLRRAATFMAALGTVCDVMSIRDPFNRSLVKYGVTCHDDLPAGLAALLQVSGIGDEVTARDCGWRIGPRLNAGGRMGLSALAAACLRERDPVTAVGMAENLEHLNRCRQRLQRRLEAELPAHDTGLAYAVCEKGNPGIAGLLASTLQKDTGWPALVLTPRPDGLLTGSGRATGFDIGAAVRAALEAGLLEAGGGHAAACGVTVRRDAVDALGRFVQARMDPAWVPETSVDAELLPADLARLDALARAQLQLEPWGQEFAEPVYAVSGVSIGTVRETQNGHLMLTCLAGGVPFEAVWWSPPADWRSGFEASGGAAVLGNVELHTWRSRSTPRLVVRAARAVELADSAIAA